VSADVALMIVRWDRLLSFLRRKYRKLDCYGCDTGGDAEALRRVMRDDALLETVANELFRIDCAHQAAMAKAQPIIDAANKARADAESALLGKIK